MLLGLASWPDACLLPLISAEASPVEGAGVEGRELTGQGARAEVGARGALG